VEQKGHKKILEKGPAYFAEYDYVTARGVHSCGTVVYTTKNSRMQQCETDLVSALSFSHSEAAVCE